MSLPSSGSSSRWRRKSIPECRSAPLYIDGQQCGSVHGLNENIHQGTLRHGIAFYKQIIRNAEKVHA